MTNIVHLKLDLKVIISISHFVTPKWYLTDGLGPLEGDLLRLPPKVRRKNGANQANSPARKQQQVRLQVVTTEAGESAPAIGGVCGSTMEQCRGRAQRRIREPDRKTREAKNTSFKAFQWSFKDDLDLKNERRWSSNSGDEMEKLGWCSGVEGDGRSDLVYLS
ncbi:hypothetical protein Syun_027385 [Stephania yunnanensis]|uniref:Uncharacterized protein n=1 Tax=Stephania yunnanensis TaxID=152371 RepID=A0AAP0HMR9_9MAGN